MSRHPDPAEVAIPAPREAAEPIRGARAETCTPRRSGVGDRPGWLSLLEALDAFAAGLVARFEHELTHADAEHVAQLHRKAERARRLEGATAAAVAQAARRA